MNCLNVTRNYQSRYLTVQVSICHSALIFLLYAFNTLINSTLSSTNSKSFGITDLYLHRRAEKSPPERISPRKIFPLGKISHGKFTSMKILPGKLPLGKLAYRKIPPWKPPLEKISIGKTPRAESYLLFSTRVTNLNVRNIIFLFSLVCQLTQTSNWKCISPKRLGWGAPMFIHL